MKHGRVFHKFQRSTDLIKYIILAKSTKNDQLLFINQLKTHEKVHC